MILICFGIQSNCTDGSHIFMGDIDKDISLSKVISTCKTIQQEYLLSTIYILKSTNGFNIFSLDKMELEAISNILSEYEIFDTRFNLMGLEHKHYCLRMGDDKKHVHTALNYVNGFEQSKPHYHFFKYVMHFDILPDKFDNLERITLKTYKSRKYGRCIYEKE